MTLELFSPLTRCIGYTNFLTRAIISCLTVVRCKGAACSAIPRGGSFVTIIMSRQQITPNAGVTLSAHCQ